MSSIMPQKRNPAALEQLRTQSSNMVGEMQTIFLLAHNTRTGMFDYRSYDPVPSERPLQVYQLFQQILDGLVVNKARAMAEVNADYSMTTEIADALLKKADVPFRVGHHFASLLTNYGRGLGLKLGEIPYSEAVRIYKSDAKQDFPLSETEFKETIDAEHWGLVPKVSPNVPIVMGQAAERIMRAAADFVPDAFAPKASKHLESGKPLQIGPFAITPHLADHSGFDAYALVIEADGPRLFYSSDLRAHGRKSKLFERMLKKPPKNIDVMLMEGSSLGRRADDEDFPTEKALERIFIERFKNTPGMVLVACSPQNIDRVVTIYRAVKQTGRTLVVDAYAAEVLKATGYNSIPKPVRGWTNIAVFIPQRRRVQLIRRKIVPIVDSYRGFRMWPERLAEQASSTVMLFRPWMLGDLERAGALGGAKLIWSQWDGYLKEGPGAQLKADCKARGIPFEVIHTSGHASVVDLKRLATAVRPKALVPIHTFEAARFPALFENVVLHRDGEWWEV